MKIHTLKVHSNFKKWGLLNRKALFSLFILLSVSTQSKVLKIAIVDTGFCLEKLRPSKLIMVLPKVDITQTNNYKCENTPKESRRLHGQWVLDVLTKQLNLGTKEEEVSLQITPIVIFDKFGHQKQDYWKTAIKFINTNDFNLLLSAVALPLKDIKIAANLPDLEVPIALFAAQRKSKDIKKQTALYPHILTPKENILIIGSYHKDQVTLKAHYADSSLTHPETINYFMPFEGDHPNLKGSSFAVTQAARKTLEYCLAPLLSRSTNLIKKCLEKKKSNIQVKLKGKAFKEFPSLE